MRRISITLALVICATAATAQTSAGPLHVRAADIHVTDGDTIKLAGHPYRASERPIG
jgi:hypothetical protein